MATESTPDDAPDETNPSIVQTEGVLGGKPRIAGRRIGVRFVHEQVEDVGITPRTVADRYDIDIADVYRALAYYHEHPEQMARIEHERREAVAELRDEALTPEASE